MRITEFKKIGKSVKYKVFVDSDFWCILIDETIIKYNLKKDIEYNEEFLNVVKEEGQKKLAFNTALKHISAYSKTKKELSDYLLKKSFSVNAVNFAIKKLQEYNYLNDTEYAKNYINFKKDIKGKKAIEFELKRKGINSEIIKNCTEKLIINQNEAIFKLAEKFLRNKLFKNLPNKAYTTSFGNENLIDATTKFFQDNLVSKNEQIIIKNKLFNHLSIKGFKYNEIKQVLNKIFE